MRPLRTALLAITIVYAAADTAQAQRLGAQCRAGQVEACQRICDMGHQRGCRAVRKLQRRRGHRNDQYRRQRGNRSGTAHRQRRSGRSVARDGRTLAIIIPGQGGANRSNFLMRNLGRFSSAGLQTIVTVSARRAAAIARNTRARGTKVVLVGMSLGSIKAAYAVAAGAPLNGVVFVSGNMPKVMRIVGSPRRLPATLVVHNPADACHKTTPAGARRFARWAGRRARLRWVSSPPVHTRRVCSSFHTHGFYGNDARAVSVITSFVRSR